MWRDKETKREWEERITMTIQFSVCIGESFKQTVVKLQLLTKDDV